MFFVYILLNISDDISTECIIIEYNMFIDISVSVNHF